MGSHADYDHLSDESRVQWEAQRKDFLRELKIRAEVMESLSKNTLQNEPVLLDWKHDGIRCQLLPDDRQKILRISIGGGDDLPIKGDYCNIRGDIGKCIALLERAITALKKHPS